MKRRIILCVLALLLFVGLSFAEEAGPRFAIFRVDLIQTDGAPKLEHPNINRVHLNTIVTEEYVLATASKHETPVLTDLDIVEYCWATQRIELTEEGARKWDSQGGREVPLTGLPLLVCVDGEPQYAAMLWNPASSLCCKLPQIWCKAHNSSIRIGCRYMSAEGDTILGGCYNAEVKQMFAELGKLREECRIN